uniref:Uncharacterized protein n=1 Tax=Globodera rostochiensis TaxID=31243 RepID=A0A914H797_GLORO
MTETNSAQIAAEQESSSTSLNNAVRELQVIRARILELEDQQQTTNSTTLNTVLQRDRFAVFVPERRRRLNFTFPNWTVYASLTRHAPVQSLFLIFQ